MIRGIVAMSFCLLTGCFSDVENDNACVDGVLNCPCRQPVGDCNDDLVCDGGTCRQSAATGTVGPSANLEDSGTDTAATTAPTASSSGADTSEATGQLGPDSHTLFITLGAHTGDLGGLDGANELCGLAASDLAVAPPANATWNAYLYDDATSPASRFVLNGPVYDASGGLLVKDPALLFTSDVHPTMLANGNLLPADDLVWLGDEVSSCSTWSSEDGLGRFSQPYEDWTVGPSNSCSNNAHVYCISL